MNHKHQHRNGSLWHWL